MIRTFQSRDLDAVLKIWLENNIKAHSFIPSAYWTGQTPAVRELLPQAELYVYEDNSRELLGFIGLTGSDIAGLFVREDAQSQGIGAGLLEQAKSLRSYLTLGVYQKNCRAVRFYRREGFTVQREQTDEATGEREFRMIWKKTPAL